MSILDSDYLRQLRSYRQTFENISEITSQIDLIIGVCIDLEQKKVPKRSFQMLGLNETTYLSALIELSQNHVTTTLAQQTTLVQKLDHLLRNFRDFIEGRFGIWALFTEQFLKRWTQVFPDLRYLEIMAGNGLFSAGMKRLQQSVITTDDLSWGKGSQTARDFWTPVESYDAISAVETFGQAVDAIVMIWSQDQNPVDFQVLQTLRQKYPDKYFFVIGEKYGATNSTLFWDQAHYQDTKALVRLNKMYPRFDLIQDQVYLVQ